MKAQDKANVEGSLLMLISLFIGNFYETGSLYSKTELFTGYQLILMGPNMLGLLLIFIPLTILAFSVFLGNIRPLICITLSLVAINLLFYFKIYYINLLASVNFSSGARIFLIGATFIVFENSKDSLQKLAKPFL